MVEETLLASIRPGSCKSTNLAQQNKQAKMSLEIFYRKAAEGWFTSAGAVIQVYMVRLAVQLEGSYGEITF
jgi:hypothetical protein